jgi:hypothetical protein
MFMGNLYATNTWKVMVGSKRTTVSEYIEQALGKH